MRRPSQSAGLLLASLSLAACSTLLDLGTLTKVECLDDCPESGSSGAASLGGGNLGGAGNARAGTSSAGTHSGSTAGSPSASGGSTGSGSSGSQSGGSGGDAAGAAASLAGNGGEALGGQGGSTGNGGPCVGGPAPPLTWQEHWFEHDQLLTLDQYDACVAVYVDADMTHAEANWVAAFLSKSWRYSLENYGRLGPDRLFAALHRGRYLGGHSAAFFDPTHDSRNMIDPGANVWTEGDYDLPAHLLSFVVEETATHLKHGSPASSIWQGEGFAQIFKYDLYAGLGMTDEAAEAFDVFEPTHFSYPVPNSYWFADWYYPVWRDHGGTALLVKFFALLEQYYPALDQAPSAMSFGEYVHFMSGAAGADLKEQATYAFGWNNDWQQQLDQARSAYPQLTYPR